MSARGGGRSAKAKDRATSKECQEREQVQVSELQRRQHSLLLEKLSIGKESAAAGRRGEAGGAAGRTLRRPSVGERDGGGGRWLPESPR